MNDLRFAIRQLWKAPGFTLVVIATLALGIGANSAIFTVVNAILWQKLPFAAPGRLVQVESTTPSLQHTATAPSVFLDWKARNHVFSSLLAYTGEGFVVSGGKEAELLWGSRVSADFLGLVGADPIIGRGFIPGESRAGHDQVVLIGYGVWQRRFAGDPRVLGRELMLNGRHYAIIGVMPDGFFFPTRSFNLWTPLVLTAGQEATQSIGGLGVMARLKKGVSVEQAQREMTGLAQALTREDSSAEASLGVKVTSFLDLIFRNVRPALLTLFAAAGFVLLIACANVANLLLARAGRRRKEFAIRRAVGATRWQVVRLLLSESVLLGLIGGALGAVLAVWAVDLLVALRPAYGPLLAETGVNGRVFAFLFVTSLVSSVAFGLVPAWQVSRLPVGNGLKEANRSTVGATRQRARKILVGGEVGLALVLLIGGGLFTQSFLRLAAVRPGFRADHALAISLALPVSKYPSSSQQSGFFRSLIDRLRQLPGVQNVGAVTSLPLYGSNATVFQPDGRRIARNSAKPTTYYDAVSPDFFAAMGVPLLKGRSFSAHDDSHAPPVIIINQTMARRYFPNENPIGRRIALGEKADWREIVGIVGDVKSGGPAAEIRPAVYVPYLQNTPAYIAGNSASMDLVVRTASDPLAIATSVRSELQRLDKDVPITKLETMTRLLNESIAQERFNTVLLASFGVLAVILAGLGIYGLVAYTVGERVQEIGIRMALGAQRGDIIALVVRGTMFVVLLGLAVGVFCSIALSRVVASLLFQISPIDAVTYGGVALLLIFVALAACLLPARRATRISPMAALRHE